MRKIEIELYRFNELSEEAQQVAIERERNDLEEYGHIYEWVLDDCGLFEPSHYQLVALLGDDYKFPLLKNNRQGISYDLGYGIRYIQIEKALEITNKKHFLTWLGLPSELIYQYLSDEDDFDFDIISIGDYRTSMIVFHNYDDKYEKIIKQAKEKFIRHLETILKRIEKDIEYMLSDEAIKESLEESDYEYLKNGKLPYGLQ